MTRAMTRALALALTLALTMPAGAQTPAGVTDPDVVKGIKQVDDADYDGAIFTLDAAARRLAGDPKKAPDLSQAYLYLGIAYMGKGHEAAARAKFREAVGQIKDISLSPDRFPPKVIDALEAAREEVKKGGGAATAAAPPEKKGGSKKILIIGGVAAVGAGVALAAGGGGGSDTPSGPTDTRRTETFSGSLCGYNAAVGGGCDQYRSYDIVVASAGTLDAEVNWGNGALFFELYLSDDQYQDVARSNRITNTQSRMTAQVSPRTSSPSAAYHLTVSIQSDGTSDNFTLTIRHP